MKNFLAIYTGTAASTEHSGWNSLSDAERKQREREGMEAWSQWMQAHQARIVDSGGPLGKTKRASAEGIDDTRNAMAGYVIVRAESHDDAVQLFENHPHFAIFPGEAVEVMECLPIPEPSQ